MTYIYDGKKKHSSPRPYLQACIPHQELATVTLIVKRYNTKNKKKTTITQPKQRKALYEK